MGDSVAIWWLICPHDDTTSATSGPETYAKTSSGRMSRSTKDPVEETCKESKSHVAARRATYAEQGGERQPILAITIIAAEPHLRAPDALRPQHEVGAVQRAGERHTPQRSWVRHVVWRMTVISLRVHTHGTCDTAHGRAPHPATRHAQTR